MSQLLLTDLKDRTINTLEERAARNGRTPPEEAKAILIEALAPKPLVPRDEWERGLLEAARPWGGSFSDAALSSEGLYD